MGNAYVPDGLSAAQWQKMRADKKKNAAANKLKYPKGAAQVVGVKEYLEDLAKKQTFFRDAAGNSRVGDTGHKWAKVKFGEFTKEAYDEWRAKGGKKLPNQITERPVRAAPPSLMTCLTYEFFT